MHQCTSQMTGVCHQERQFTSPSLPASFKISVEANLFLLKAGGKSCLKNWPWICAWSSCCRRRGRPCGPWWCDPRRPKSRPQSPRPASDCPGPPRCSTGSCSISDRIDPKSSQEGHNVCKRVCVCVWRLLLILEFLFPSFELCGGSIDWVQSPWGSLLGSPLFPLPSLFWPPLPCVTSARAP